MSNSNPLTNNMTNDHAVIVVDPKSPVQRRRRTGLLIFSILYTILYVGAFFGWGPMQLLVRRLQYAVERDCLSYPNESA
jgi:hypothetical protein